MNRRSLPDLMASNRISLIVAAAFIFGATASLASSHPLLAQDSPWPACHGNAYASDSTDWPGPAAAVTEGFGLTAQLVTQPKLMSRSTSYLPVSLVFGSNASSGAEVVWGTSVSAVMLLQVVSSSDGTSSWLELVDSLHTGSIDLSCVFLLFVQTDTLECAMLGFPG